MVRKDKVHLELNLIWDIKSNKQGFYKYLSRNRRAKEKVSPLLNGVGALLTQDIEKAEVLNAVFTLVFTGKTNFQ